MLLTIKKVKELYDISRITLINWEKEGLITPVRTPKGRRRYKKEDIEKLLGMLEEKPKPKVVLYARVSTKKQEEYLKNQIRRLEEYANSQGWQYEVISEIASGVNEIKELAEDLIAIVTSFAARIYGQRGGKKHDSDTG
ncbi:MerR family DNA-binding transcriptional regulator [Caldanaerobacter subterraneus KAk]|uniref:MerR family DNA-binding transcriptional regulator n=1 Tax=Caldanaerobacter subterraneus TaxID=911092 RepID=UPI0032C0C938